MADSKFVGGCSDHLFVPITTLLGREDVEAEAVEVELVHRLLT